MDHRHLRGDIGEIERLLDCGIAAADHGDVLVAEEEAVAGRAGGDAKAAELLLGRELQPFGLGPRGYDQGIGGIDVAAVAIQAERPARQVGLGDIVRDHHRADMLGLLAHLLHQPGPLDTEAKPG